MKNWVKDGGGLVLMGNDSANAEFKHLNELASVFGLQFDENSKNRVQGNNFEEGAIRVPAKNRIFKTAKKLYIKELSTISFVKYELGGLKDTYDIVLKNATDNIICVKNYGRGRVIAIGDPWLYNEYVDGRKLPADFDNYKAATDLVKWLVKGSEWKKK